jgi:hypothetical protein
VQSLTVSYGTNAHIGEPWRFKADAMGEEGVGALGPKRWMPASVEKPSTIPFLFDCAHSGATHRATAGDRRLCGWVFKTDGALPSDWPAWTRKFRDY